MIIVGTKLMVLSLTMLATASSASASFLKSSAKAYAASEGATSSATDITTSSAVHDCFLLFKGANAKWEGFNPFYDCLPATRRFDWFSYVAARPYKSDLYTYWYWNDSNKYGYTFDKGATYAITILATKADSSGNVIWDNGGQTLSLEMVGEPYHVGNQWLLKFAARNVFPNPKVGESFGYQLFEFGKSADGGIDQNWRYSVNEKQLFSYDDDQYDITSSIWGDKTSVVSITKSDAYPLVAHKNVSGNWEDSGNWEMHGLYFDLDRSPDYIKHIDIEYQMVEYYVSALHNYNGWTEGNIEACTLPVYINHGPLRVPDSPSYTPENEIEKKYEGTEYATKVTPMHKDIYASDTIDFTQAKNNFFGGWFGIPKQTVYTTHAQSIIEIGKTQIDDENMRDWVNKNCVKKDGSNYQYAVFYDLTSEEWTDEVVEYKKTGSFFSKKEEYYKLVRCHTSQGVYITKMTVMEGLEELEWNAFMQPVNEKPGVVIGDHEFTIGEMLIAWGKANKPWLRNIVMVAYVLVCTLLVGGLSYRLLTGGTKEAKTAVVERKPRGKKSKK